VSTTTRRGFVKNSAAAAAGATIVGSLMTADAEAKKVTHRGPVMAWIGDTRHGEITIMAGERQIKVRDHQLVARIARLAR
jgi:hypothetical protein